MHVQVYANPRDSTNCGARLLAMLASPSIDEREASAFFIDLIQQMQRHSCAFGRPLANGFHAGLVPPGILYVAESNGYRLYFSVLISSGAGRAQEVRALHVCFPSAKEADCVAHCYAVHASFP